MEKILVTTDLSANSKAALRFAINLSKQKSIKLVFLHVHQVLRASTWSDSKYEYYVAQDKENLQKELDAFVADVYRYMKVKPRNYSCEVFHRYGITEAIEEYAINNACDYICIATRGAGTLKKLIGTHTGKLITSSKVPVISVPSNYRVSPVNKVLYASDMTSYEDELAKVVGFAKPLKAAVEMLHMSFPFEWLLNEEIAEKELKKKYKYPVDLHYEQRDIENTLLTDLSTAVQRSKPAVVALFTNKGRGFFERLFMSSLAEQYSFSSKVPLLIFAKNNVE